MFEHIGRKVKVFVKTLFWVEAIAFGILGLTVAIKAENALLFLLIAIGGAVASYLSVIVLYVIAQLVDNSDILVENSRKQLEALRTLQTQLQKLVPAEAAAQAPAMQTPAGEPEPEAAPAAESETQPVPDAEAEPEQTPAVESTPQAEPEEPPAEQPETESEPVNLDTQEPASESETQEEDETQTQEPAQADAQNTPEEDAQAPCDASAEQLPEKTCKVCGFGLTDDVYCPNCGSKISEQEQPSEPDGVCPGCGYTNAFGKFCPRCGLHLRGGNE